MPKAKSTAKEANEQMLADVISQLDQQQEMLADIKLAIEELNVELEEIGTRLLDIENQLAS